MLSVRLEGNRTSTVVELNTGIRRDGPPVTWMSPLTTLPSGEWRLDRFRELVATVREQGLSARLELVRLDGTVKLRVSRLSGPRVYRLMPVDTPIDRVLSFLRRRAWVRSGRVRMSSGVRNLITGRNSEKLLHEWLSHPAEDGIKRPEGVTLRSVPASHDSPEPRLVRGSFTAEPVPLPADWLLVRTVTDGWFDGRTRRVFLTVSEAFERTGDLIQSVHPFRMSMTLADMDAQFAGSVSRRVMTNGGYYCSKYGESVFGRIESPALLFQELPFTVEE